MGWSRGSRLFHDIIIVINEYDIDKNDRRYIYLKLIPVFEDEDWDTQNECIGEDEAYDEAIDILHPEWRK